MEPKIITGKSSNVVIIDKPNESIVYANIAGVMVSSDDVVIHLGLRHMDDPQKGDGVAKVYLSFAHAKRLLHALTQGLGFYEKAFGEIITEPVINLTPEQQKQMGILSNAE